MTPEPVPPSGLTPSPPAPPAAGKLDAEIHSPARILVADDDEMFGSFLVEFFRREGCTCDRVLEAVAAERHLRENEYDLLVADIFMPGNVGLELIENLPQIAAGLPVILLTDRKSVV